MSAIATSHPGSDLLVGGEVVLLLRFSAKASVRFLFLVADLELREVQRHLVRRDHVALSGSSDLIRADEHILECDLEIFLLPATGLARRECGGLEVLAGRARDEEPRRTLVQPLDEVKVLRLDLARAGSGAVSRRPGLLCAPAEGLDFDLSLVLVIRRFGVDPGNFQEIVNLCHVIFSSAGDPVVSTATGPLKGGLFRRRPSATAASRPAAAKPSVLRAGSAVAGRTSTCSNRGCLPLPPPRLPRQPAASAPSSSRTNWRGPRPRSS